MDLFHMLTKYCTFTLMAAVFFFFFFEVVVKVIMTIEGPKKEHLFWVGVGMTRLICLHSFNDHVQGYCFLTSRPSALTSLNLHSNRSWSSDTESFNNKVPQGGMKVSSDLPWLTLTLTLALNVTSSWTVANTSLNSGLGSLEELEKGIHEHIFS